MSSDKDEMKTFYLVYGNQRAGGKPDKTRAEVPTPT